MHPLPDLKYTKCKIVDAVMLQRIGLYLRSCTCFCRSARCDLPQAHWQRVKSFETSNSLYQAQTPHKSTPDCIFKACSVKGSFTEFWTTVLPIFHRISGTHMQDILCRPYPSKIGRGGAVLLRIMMPLCKSTWRRCGSIVLLCEFLISCTIVEVVVVSMIKAVRRSWQQQVVVCL